MFNSKLAEKTNRRERTFGSLIVELKDELVEFFQTRWQLLISEMQAHSKLTKKAAQLAGVALFFAGFAFLLLTAAAVALVTLAFLGSPFALFCGFLIVGVCYLLLSGITSIVAYFALQGLAPEKTVTLIHDDKTWVTSELRNSIRV